MGAVMLSFLTGIAIGGVYFAGLWETVRKLPEAEKPIRRMVLSFVLRATLAVACFTLVMQGGWECLAAAMLGFLTIREILLRSLGKKPCGLIGGTGYGNRCH